MTKWELIHTYMELQPIGFTEVSFHFIIFYSSCFISEIESDFLTTFPLTETVRVEDRSV